MSGGAYYSGEFVIAATGNFVGLRLAESASIRMGEITLRPQDGSIIAEIGGNVGSLLELDGGNSGAGSPSLLPSNIYRLKLGRLPPPFALRRGKVQSGSLESRGEPMVPS